MHPAAIVTDLLLGSDTHGVSLCERLIADDRTRHIRVIVVTGLSYPDLAARVARTGCVAVHTKPVLPQDLVDIVTRALRDDPAAPLRNDST